MSSLPILMKTMATTGPLLMCLLILTSNFRPDFDAIRKLCHPANLAIAEDASSVFGLALQNLNAIMEGYSAVPAKIDTSEPIHVVEKTAAASLATWDLKNIYMVCERDEAHARE